MQPDQIARVLRYYDYVLQERTVTLTNYLSTISQLDKVSAAIKNSLTELHMQQQSLEVEKNYLVEQQQVRKQVLRQLSSKLQSKDDELKSLQKDRNELEKIIAAVKEAVSHLSLPDNIEPFEKCKGKLSWPVKGTIVSKFGSKRQGKIKWEGVTIKAQADVVVHSVHHGRVVFSDWLRGQGLLLIVDHGDGYMSLYAHNAVLSRDIGDWVNAGEQIGRVGNTGGQEKNGLYFEIRHNGKPINPQQWIKAG